jgi:hypothetical protein
VRVGDDDRRRRFVHEVHEVDLSDSQHQFAIATMGKGGDSDDGPSTTYTKTTRTSKVITTTVGGDASERGGGGWMVDSARATSGAGEGDRRASARELATTTKVRYEDMPTDDKLETSEKRLFETQATLVRERLKREVTENILRETAKSLSAVRKAALQGQLAEQTGGPLAGSVEYQNEVLMTRVRELTQKMMDLQGQHAEKDGELASLRRLLQQRENEFDLIGERPVSIHLELKEFNDPEQEKLIDQTRQVLEQAQQQAEAVHQLRQIDRQRTRALGDLVRTMEARRKELQDKLREAGIAEDYDDDRVAAAAKNGFGDDVDGAVQYEGPVSSPSGRSFYVTRTANFWDRFFGIQI